MSYWESQGGYRDDDGGGVDGAGALVDFSRAEGFRVASYTIDVAEREGVTWSDK